MSSAAPAVFLFHREFRHIDNSGLNLLARSHQKILPVFIFDPVQIDRQKNKYFSNKCVQFMIQSLEDLDTRLRSLDTRMIYLHGDTVQCLAKLHKRCQFDRLVSHEDVTPFADRRDENIRSWCDKHQVNFFQAQDYDLYDLTDGLREGKPYQVFTPFWNNVLKNYRVPPVDTLKLKSEHFVSQSRLAKIKFALKPSEIHDYYDPDPRAVLQGGRDNAMVRFDHLKKLKDYEKTRDLINIDGSSMLSAYLKFGCLSIREVYWRLHDLYGPKHGLIRELNWKCFYNRISKFIPRVLMGKAMKPQYDNVDWSWNKQDLRKWAQGMTGFPIIDASMRALNSTGFLSNRLRMIVAMFATKDLLLHWSLPEAAFARFLLDYDPSANNGGWGFASGHGADAAPYFRIFNPNTQSKRYDPEATYLKKWLPELEDVPARDIHDWETKHPLYKHVKYPKPMVNHKEASKRAKDVIGEGIKRR